MRHLTPHKILITLIKICMQIFYVEWSNTTFNLSSWFEFGEEEKIIKMSQKMSQCKIAKELGISRHFVQVTQKKHAYVGNISDMEKKN